MMFRRGDRFNHGDACMRSAGVRARRRAFAWAVHLEDGGTAPASVLWVFGRCIARTDLPDLRRWLVVRAFEHWRSGRSLNRTAERPGKGQWFERAIHALGPAGGVAQPDALMALKEELAALHPGITGRRSVHGPRRRRVPDSDLLLIDDVCNEALSEHKHASLARLIEWNALAFCITNVDLRWQLTAESAPRLRELAQWFARRAAEHEAAGVVEDIVGLREHARMLGESRGVRYEDEMVALVALPTDARCWRDRHVDRLDHALAYLRLRSEGLVAMPYGLAARMQSEAGGRLEADDWFDRLHDSVESARRNWRYWERVLRWRSRRQTTAT